MNGSVNFRKDDVEGSAMHSAVTVFVSLRATRYDKHCLVAAIRERVAMHSVRAMMRDAKPDRE